MVTVEQPICDIIRHSMFSWGDFPACWSRANRHIADPHDSSYKHDVYGCSRSPPRRLFILCRNGSSTITKMKVCITVYRKNIV